uniref:Uncharacterized protein n=1 Tax=Oryza barthii TaxID=65489 RepID=A0A0D3GRU5_9ORYZ
MVTKMPTTSAAGTSIRQSLSDGARWPRPSMMASLHTVAKSAAGVPMVAQGSGDSELMDTSYLILQFEDEIPTGRQIERSKVNLFRYMNAWMIGLGHIQLTLWSMLRCWSHLWRKSTPKVPQLVIELQNRPPTIKPDIWHPQLKKPFT